uniref:Transposase n=1 Tax=Cyanothece sp. (strain PCC 7425 / ATCC 29141) TaxID=395961 RepID=B8HMZ9_CYAP4
MSESNQWSREECRNRYVRGEKISLRELSRLSSRALGLLGRWCKEDGWTEQREQYRLNSDRKSTKRRSSELPRQQPSS